MLVLARYCPTLRSSHHCNQSWLHLDLAENWKSTTHDTVLMLSINGAQLYKGKTSTTWIYIWIPLDLTPDKRYMIQNILLGGVIPGPEAPGDIDSFLFPSLAHLSALQKEGLPIWDTFSRERVIAYSSLQNNSALFEKPTPNFLFMCGAQHPGMFRSLSLEETTATTHNALVAGLQSLPI